MPYSRHPYPPRRAAGPNRNQGGFQPRRHDDKPAPKSAAWLQAEQLFAAAPAPAASADAPPVDIQVRRNRAAPPENGPVPQGGTTAPAAKTPRVFRVDSPVSEAAAEPTPAPVEATPEPAAAVRPTPRARRVPEHKRPGPVLQVFTAPQAEPLALEETLELRHLLADVNPLLADVERAKAFQFIDDVLVQRWSTVTQAIAQLHSEVSTLEARSLRVEEEDAAA